MVDLGGVGAGSHAPPGVPGTRMACPYAGFFCYFFFGAIIMTI